MRLLKSEVYRGRQVRVYIVHPGGFTHAPQPALGVRIDGQVVEQKPYLTDMNQLSDALVWAHAAIDRLMGGQPGQPGKVSRWTV